MSEKGRYVELIRLHILVNCMELRWRQPCSDPVAPCMIMIIRKGEERRKKKREVSHLFRWYTHTPGRSRVNPERQEEEKSGHKRRANDQNSAGGEGNRRTSGTNLHGETDLTRNRAHT